MATEVLVAIITAVPTALVAIVSVVMQNRLSNFKIDELKAQVEKHNQVVERTYKLESDMSTVWKRYDDMKADIQEVLSLLRKEGR